MPDEPLTTERLHPSLRAAIIGWACVLGTGALFLVADQVLLPMQTDVALRTRDVITLIGYILFPVGVLAHLIGLAAVWRLKGLLPARGRRAGLWLNAIPLGLMLTLGAWLIVIFIAFHPGVVGP